MPAYASSTGCLDVLCVLRTHCHKVLPLDCLLTPLPSPPSWDHLNCLETCTRSFWTLSPRRVWIHRGSQKLLERVSRQFRGSWRGVEGGDCGTGRLNGEPMSGHRRNCKAPFPKHSSARSPAKDPLSQSAPSRLSFNPLPFTPLLGPPKLSRNWY